MIKLWGRRQRKNYVEIAWRKAEKAALNAKVALREAQKASCKHAKEWEEARLDRQIEALTKEREVR